MLENVINVDACSRGGGVYVDSSDPTLTDLVVMDNEFDAIFGHLPGWFSDRHPNLAGYNVIAVETVKYLLPLIREQSR